MSAVIALFVGCVERVRAFTPAFRRAMRDPTSRHGSEVLGLAKTLDPTYEIADEVIE